MVASDMHDRFPYKFYLLYALIYMCNAVYNTFIPVYLDNIGLSRSIIGTLLALGPFVAIIAQPVWGSASDRARTKNTILKIILLGCAVTILLYRVSTSYSYLFIIMSLFMSFHTVLPSISDAITLEYLENTGWRFGPVRMAGTIGFAAMSVIAGTFARQNINSIFPMYSFLAFLALLIAFSLPGVKGHQSDGHKTSIWKVFKYPGLVLLMAFTLVIQASLGYYYSFFPIYYRQLGADTILLGLASLISALSEIPFLLFAEKILKRLGTKKTLLLSGTATAVRWLLIYAVSDVYILLLIKLLHGSTFIVLSYTMATYISRNMPKELRASGQAVNGIVGQGIARILGSILGGFTSDLIGIRQVFLYDSILAFTAVAVFSLLFIRKANSVSIQQV